MPIKSIIILAATMLEICRGAAVSSQILPAAPALPTTKLAIDTGYDPHPQYSYAYDVQDALTGDVKSQYETRDGDVVSGSYSLTEADGIKRIVEYIADPVNGFNAVVRREPVMIVKPVIKVPKPFIYHN